MEICFTFNLLRFSPSKVIKIPSKKDGMCGPWLWWHPNDVFKKQDDFAEDRHEDREDSYRQARGGLGGLREEEERL